MQNWIISLMQNFEICITEYTDNLLFDFFAEEIQSNFGGILLESVADCLETRYYDFNINGNLITLHQMPTNGITIYPTNNEVLEYKDINLYRKISSFLKNKINDKI